MRGADDRTGICAAALAGALGVTGTAPALAAPLAAWSAELVKAARLDAGSTSC